MVQELKAIADLAGGIRIAGDVLGLSAKANIENVGIGLPSWDPPPEVPGLPPDHVTVARVEASIGVSALDETRAYNEVMALWRKVAAGEPQQPVQVETKANRPPQTQLIAAKKPASPAQ